MTLQSFKETIDYKEPPAELNEHVLALWYDGKGDWERSHEIIQDLEDSDSAWIHAYLHRKEGDIGNADYWYRRAGKTRPSLSLSEEWESIITDLLQRN